MSLDGNIQVLDLVQGKLVIGTFTGQVSLLSLSGKDIVDVVAQYQFGEPVENIHFNARTDQLIIAGRHGKFGLYKVSSSND